MRAKSIEYTIIKISILLSCLIIGGGLAQRYLEARQVQPLAKEGAPISQPATPNTASSGENPQAIPEQNPPSQAKAMGKVVAIGDSFTYGYPFGADFSWVKLAGQALGREFINQGKPSQTSADLLARFKSDVLDLSPETVIVTVGTRDGMLGVPLEKYQENIQEIIRLARSQSINPVLGLPLPYPDANSKKLVTSYREWLIGYAQANDLKIIDFNPGLIDANGNLEKELTDDGKYPSKHGYELMAQVVEKIFQ